MHTTVNMTYHIETPMTRPLLKPTGHIPPARAASPHADPRALSAVRELWSLRRLHLSALAEQLIAAEFATVAGAPDGNPGRLELTAAGRELARGIHRDEINRLLPALGVDPSTVEFREREAPADATDAASRSRQAA